MREFLAWVDPHLDPLRTYFTDLFLYGSIEANGRSSHKTDLKAGSCRFPFCSYASIGTSSNVVEVENIDLILLNAYR